jgi:PiT family inorganic phosphate transporter
MIPLRPWPERTQSRRHAKFGSHLAGRHDRIRASVTFIFARPNAQFQAVEEGSSPLIVSLLTFAALFLAFSNGANDNFKGFATVWGSASLDYRRALVLATLATILGGIASVLIADGLVQQFSGKGLVGNELANTPRFALAVASGAACTVILATRLGFPISTTHALVGGLVGAGLAQGSEPIHLGNLGSGFILPLLTSPFLSALFAFLAYLILRRLRRNPVEDCFCIVEKETVVARGASTTATIAQETVIMVADDATCDSGPKTVLRGSIARILDGLHLFSASTICFARGVNDTPKLAALFIGAQLFSGANSAFAVTAAMAGGGWLLSRRVAETMSLKINHLDPVQGISANLITAGLVLGASRFGLPVSTTHVSVGSIIGTGTGAGTLDLSVVRNVLLSWVATLPIAAGIAFTVGLLV